MKIAHATCANMIETTSEKRNEKCTHSCDIVEEGENRASETPMSQQSTEVSQVVATSHPDYGYEDAAPQVQIRSLQNKTLRRNSIVGRIMTWAGAINDEEFYKDNTQQIKPTPDGWSRRASMDGRLSTAAKEQQSSTHRHRFPSSDDAEIRLEHGECDYDDYNLDEDGDHTNHRQPDRTFRRNSLHAMVERAMAYVNLTRNDSDDELSPFGNRRDSLF